MDNPSTTLADDGFTGPSDVPSEGFFQKYQIPMYILFSTIAILIFGCSLWICCSRGNKSQKKNDLELNFQFHPNLPSFMGHGHLPGSSRVKRGREDDIMALPFSHPLYSVPLPYGHQQDGGGRAGLTHTEERYDNRSRGRQGSTRRTSSGWWRHSNTPTNPSNRRHRPLYQRRQYTRNGNRNRNGMCLGIRVPPTTGTPLDSAYSLAYMQEETPSQIQTPQEQGPGQRREHWQEEYEMEDNKGRQAADAAVTAAAAAAAREETPPPPYKARRSSEDIYGVDRPPGCLCGHV